MDCYQDLPQFWSCTYTNQNLAQNPQNQPCESYLNLKGKFGPLLCMIKSNINILKLLELLVTEFPLLVIILQ